MANSAPGRAWWRSSFVGGAVVGLAASAVLDVLGGPVVLVVLGVVLLAVGVSPAGPLHHDRLGGERWYGFVATVAALCCPAWMALAHQTGMADATRSAVGLAVWSVAAVVVLPALPVRDAVHAVVSGVGIAMLGVSALLVLVVVANDGASWLTRVAVTPFVVSFVAMATRLARGLVVVPRRLLLGVGTSQAVLGVLLMTDGEELGLVCLVVGLAFALVAARPTPPLSLARASVAGRTDLVRLGVWLRQRSP